MPYIFNQATGGIYAAQHHDEAFSEGGRHHRRGGRLKGQDGDGHPVFERGTIGDFVCARFWPAEAGARERQLPAWTWACPAIVSTAAKASPNGGATVTEGD